MALGIKGKVTSSMQRGGGQDSLSDEISTSQEEWYSWLADVILEIAKFIGGLGEVIGAVVFLGGLITLWRKRRKAGERIGRNRPAAPRGPWLKRNKLPLTKPPASVNRAAGDLMAEAMENGLGVPLVYSPKKKRKAGTGSDGDSNPSKIDLPSGRPIANAFRRLKLYWLTHHTSPKPEFEVTDWQFAPAADFADDEGYRFSEALTLSFGLASGELAEHFKRSFMTADKYKEKTVVVADPHNVHNRGAWVRKIVVESGRVGIDDQRRKRIVLYSSPRAVAAGSHVGRTKRRRVPDDAIWLVCNTKQDAPPGPSWWEDPNECSSKQTRSHCRERRTTRTCVYPDQGRPTHEGWPVADLGAFRVGLAVCLWVLRFRPRQQGVLHRSKCLLVHPLHAGVGRIAMSQVVGGQQGAALAQKGGNDEGPVVRKHSPRIGGGQTGQHGVGGREQQTN